MDESNYCPVPIRQRMKFEAPDPWEPGQGEQPVQWRVQDYEIRRGSGAEPGGSGVPVVVGIATGSGSRYRILPLALQTLFQQGKLPAERIPALLFAMERRLRPSDYPPYEAFGSAALAVAIVALPLYYLAWQMGFGSDPVFPSLIMAIATGLMLLAAWNTVKVPLRKSRERRILRRALRILGEAAK